MSRRLLRILAIFVAVLASILAAQPDLSTSAQGGGQLTSDEAPFYCPYTNAAYYQKGLFPRYIITTHSLVLVDDKSGQTVRTLDTFTDNVRLINWSPDCRFLSGAVGKFGFAGKYRDWVTVGWNYWGIALWDTESGGRINAVRYMGGRYLSDLPVIWSPDSNYALLLSGCGSYTVDTPCETARIGYDFLWHRDDNNIIRLGNLPPEQPKFRPEVYTDYFYPEIQNKGLFNEYHWDFARQWIWGNDTGGLVTYDLRSGSQTVWFRTSLTEPKNAYAAMPESLFEFSPDGTKVVVYSTGSLGEDEIHGMAVYDISSQQGIGVNIEAFAAAFTPFAGYHPIAISPDNRYLVAGYTALRVWDLQNLPAKIEDRLPTYRHAGPKSPIWSVHFVAPLVVETESAAGRQKWDIITGRFIP